jgi:cellobiose phosphorylase
MYNNMIRLFFGFQPCFDGASICPCLPAEWRMASMSNLLRGVRYYLKITNLGGEHIKLVVNRQEWDGNFIPYDLGKAMVDIQVKLE